VPRDHVHGVFAFSHVWTRRGIRVSFRTTKGGVGSTRGMLRASWAEEDPMLRLFERFGYLVEYLPIFLG
jgi:hypothetical protein